ncbi:hypothetical protein R1flu_024693 [Riccia fluitans]|uniref:CRM domain-containing protein n=1 Tax=Riccia fluitans TaxID=41844 RepID=A0ABD1XYP8_9MARC
MGTGGEARGTQEADKKIRQRVKVARRKGKELEDELKTMLAGPDFTIIGVHSMRALKKEALESLKGELALKSQTLVYGSKISGLHLFRGPRHTLPGT